MVDRQGDEIGPSTAYRHAPLEDDAPYLLDGVAAAIILLILSDHHSVCERGKEAVRTTSHNLTCRPFRPPLYIVIHISTRVSSKVTTPCVA